MPIGRDGATHENVHVISERHDLDAVSSVGGLQSALDAASDAAGPWLVL
jgi:hypothetical protein